MRDMLELIDVRIHEIGKSGNIGRQARNNRQRSISEIIRAVQPIKLGCECPTDIGYALLQR